MKIKTLGLLLLASVSSPHVSKGFTRKPALTLGRLTRTSVFLLVSFLMSGSVFAETKSKEILVEQAVSSDTKESAEAIAELRTLGKSGLDALFAKYGTEIKKFTASNEANENWKRIAFAIDSVAQQKDAYASKLFWHTNLEEAQKEAVKSGKPILTLRLLGNLNEEFSCANSRLFRSILYSNAEISKFLNENYILHWKSVRPAPKVTIDFGDGRKIERTVTGNSIHYALDADGNIVDALPGLYSPQAFLQFLDESKGAMQKAQNTGLRKLNLYAAHRRQIFDRIVKKRNANIASAKITLTEPVKPVSGIPTAAEVMPRAMSKAMPVGELSIVNSISDDFSKFQPQLDFEDWKKLAALYASNAKIDISGTAFIRRQTGKTIKENEFTELLQNLGVFLALDTTRNDFLMRTEVYETISNSRRLSNLETINEQIYAQVFLTPKTDEWLGLYTPTLYTALDGNGIIK